MAAALLFGLNVWGTELSSESLLAPLSGGLLHGLVLSPLHLSEELAEVDVEALMVLIQPSALSDPWEAKIASSSSDSAKIAMCVGGSSEVSAKPNGEHGLHIPAPRNPGRLHFPVGLSDVTEPIWREHGHLLWRKGSC